MNWVKKYFVGGGRRAYLKFLKVASKLSPKLSSIIMYRITMKKKLNLKHPQDFNQKVMWLKLNTYYNNPIVTQCADKYAVREYIEKKGCQEILNGLYGVYDTIEEIDWNILPRQFVLKCNHGCGFNIICQDKEQLDKKAVFQQLNRWMKTNYHLAFSETNYKFIKRKIICEEFLESANTNLPVDYKILCFNGEPLTVLICTDRDTKLKLNFLDMNWESTEIGNEKIEIPEKPRSFDLMVAYSRKLSEGFPFVRIDLYDINGRVVFGEMTFTPQGGCAKYFSEYGLRFLGDAIKLPIK